MLLEYFRNVVGVSNFKDSDTSEFLEFFLFCFLRAAPAAYGGS